jgi:hypothetical protein
MGPFPVRSSRRAGRVVFELVDEDSHGGIFVPVVLMEAVVVEIQEEFIEAKMALSWAMFVTGQRPAR